MDGKASRRTWRCGRRRAVMLVLVPAAACASRTGGEIAAVCDVPPVDTTGWREVVSRHGIFAITLPLGAEDRAMPCIDSPCGRLAVGNMVIDYDSGPLAGPGTAVTVSGHESVSGECRMQRDGRTLRVVRGHFTSRPPAAPQYLHDTGTVRAGDVSVRAALPISRAGGLYLSMRSTQPADEARFLAALRTLRVLRAD